uniref:Putative secreted protein n=1 Tax=Anopheles triannulatus TaxID=58253 RepID=A0A2M4B3C6_9DIPT
MITPEPLHLLHLVTVARLRFFTGCALCCCETTVCSALIIGPGMIESIEELLLDAFGISLISNLTSPSGATKICVGRATI